jgi:hypothetical protein
MSKAISMAVDGSAVFQRAHRTNFSLGIKLCFDRSNLSGGAREFHANKPLNVR